MVSATDSTRAHATLTHCIPSSSVDSRCMSFALQHLNEATIIKTSTPSLRIIDMWFQTLKRLCGSGVTCGINHKQLSLGQTLRERELRQPTTDITLMHVFLYSKTNANTKEYKDWGGVGICMFLLSRDNFWGSFLVLSVSFECHGLKLECRYQLLARLQIGTEVTVVMK